MQINFSPNRPIKVGDNCFAIYGYEKQCDDCYLKGRTTAHIENVIIKILLCFQ